MRVTPVPLEPEALAEVVRIVGAEDSITASPSVQAAQRLLQEIATHMPFLLASPELQGELVRTASGIETPTNFKGVWCCCGRLLKI